MPDDALVPDPDAKGQPRSLMFLCPCGRCQSYAPAGRSGGITVKEAERVGWRKIDGAWACPFCSGNIANLNKIFFGD